MARQQLTLLLASLSMAACSTPFVVGGGNPYDMQRSAALAYEKGDDAKAEALYQGLARAAPNDFEIWLRLGNLYARSGRPDLAAEAYQHAAQLNPSDVRVWYNLGVIRQRQAHAAFIQAHALSGDDDELKQRTEALVKRLEPETGNEHAAEPK